MERKEIYDYSLNIINTLLRSNCWKLKKDEYCCEFYIEEEEKILVIMSEPVRIINIEAIGDKLFKTIFLKAIYDFKINVKYYDKSDLYGLAIKKENVSTISDNINKFLFNETVIEPKKEMTSNIIKDLITSRFWIELNNGICFLDYDISYSNGKCILIINDRDVLYYDMSLEEYNSFISNFEKIMYEYRIVKYGSKNCKKSLSTTDYLRSLKLYNMKNDEKKLTM